MRPLPWLRQDGERSAEQKLERRERHGLGWSQACAEIREGANSRTIASRSSTPVDGQPRRLSEILGHDRRDIEAQRAHPGVQDRGGVCCPIPIAPAAGHPPGGDREHRAGVAIARL